MPFTSGLPLQAKGSWRRLDSSASWDLEDQPACSPPGTADYVADPQDGSWDPNGCSSYDPCPAPSHPPKTSKKSTRRHRKGRDSGAPSEQELEIVLQAVESCSKKFNTAELVLIYRHLKDDSVHGHLFEAKTKDFVLRCLKKLRDNGRTRVVSEQKGTYRVCTEESCPRQVDPTRVKSISEFLRYQIETNAKYQLTPALALTSRSMLAEYYAGLAQDDLSLILPGGLSELYEALKPLEKEGYLCATVKSDQGTRKEKGSVYVTSTRHQELSEKRKEASQNRGAWQTLICRLDHLLRQHADGIFLCRLKQEYKRIFGEELNNEAYGYSKLLEFLEEFKDVAVVELVGSQVKVKPARTSYTD